MKPSKRFLLINFDFPPNQGIGGRRWAKLAKALAAQGHEIFVIKAAPIARNKNSNWSEDVQHDRIHVLEIPRTYPTSISHPSGNLLGKIRFRLDRWRLLLTERGTIYDQSIGWDKEMMEPCRKWIQEHQIDCIIATGAPWNLLVYAAQLKTQFPQCQLLVDYRDPWLTAKNYGMQSLSPKRMAHEIAKQQFVFEHADVVTTPYPYLTESLRTWSAEHATHQPVFETLSHFYDPEDIVAPTTPRARDRFTLIYAGDFYVGVESIFNEFLQSLRDLRMQWPDIYSQLRIIIHSTSTIPSSLMSESCITQEGNIGKRIFEEIANAQGCIVFLPEHKKNELTTKFAEYLPTGKPILLWAPEGYASDFVKEHQVGVHMGKDASGWIRWYDSMQSTHSTPSTAQTWESFSLQKIAEKLNQLFH